VWLESERLDFRCGASIDWAPLKSTMPEGGRHYVETC
jgi:hypothetical protein